MESQALLSKEDDIDFRFIFEILNILGCLTALFLFIFWDNNPTMVYIGSSIWIFGFILFIFVINKHNNEKWVEREVKTIDSYFVNRVKIFYYIKPFAPIIITAIVSSNCPMDSYNQGCPISEQNCDGDCCDYSACDIIQILNIVSCSLYLVGSVIFYCCLNDCYGIKKKNYHWDVNNNPLC
jgi:hypothetical protein